MSKLPATLLEFQSEARQVDQQRPPWIARATLYALVVLIAVAIVWAAMAKVDRIVVAQGKLVTTAATIVIQPLEISVVRSLDAKVGDTVRKGDPLATLDPTFSEADAAQLRDKVASLSAQIERLEAELEDRPYVPQVYDREARLQSTIWARSVEQYKAKLVSYDQQIHHAEAEIATRNSDHAVLARRLAVAQELEGMRQELYEKQIGSKINFLDSRSQRMQVDRDMQLALSQRTELEQQLIGISADRAAYVAEFRQKVGEELVQARRELDTARKLLDKAVRRNAITVLAAPADAIVLEVAERSVGSVIKEAEALYTLVPLDSPLEAEVSIDGRDVGQVSNGQPVRMKLEAWPFQKHGTLAGQVRTVSEDTFNPDPKKNAEQRPYYRARVAVTAVKLRDVPAGFRLIPGMAVTAEIKAGDRTVLSYFLYPLMRGLDESIREP
jgi:hemolysin D